MARSSKQKGDTSAEHSAGPQRTRPRSWAPALAALVAVAAGAVHWEENRVYHKHLDHLQEPVARVACLQTENGFYYSYYASLVDADTLGGGLQELVWDTRTEYPEALNALRRFNVYQEALLAVAYRLLRSAGLGLVSAWQFFRGALYLHTSVGQAAIAMLSAEISGNPLAGAACFLLCFLNRFQISRFGVFSSADLREHWGMPLLWLQLLPLWYYLRCSRSPRERQRRRRLWFALVCTTFAFIVSWQFSPFLLLLQATAVYFVCLVGGYSVVRGAAERVVDAYLVALGAAVLVHFMSPYLLTSPFLAQLVGLKLAMVSRRCCSRLSGGCGARGGFLGWSLRRLLDVAEGLLAVIAFGVVLRCMSPFATADTHIWDILCTKVAVLNDWLPQALRLHPSRLPRCTQPSFDARLYLVMGVFKEIEQSSLDVYAATTAGPGAAAACALVLLRCVVGSALRHYRRRGRSAKPRRAAPDVAPTAVASGVSSGDAEAKGLRRRKGAAAEGPAAAAPPEPVEASALEAAGDGDDEADGMEEREEAALLFFVVQFALFFLLGAFVNRLRVAFGPPMMVLAASLFGPRLFAWGRGDWRWLALLLVGYAAYVAWLVRLLPCPVESDGICGQMSAFANADGDLVDLMEWMNEQLPASMPVLASMHLSGTLRAFVGNALVIHPQFESAQLRRRVQRAYEMYHCGSEESFAQTMSRLRAQVVIFEMSRCMFTPFELDDKRKNCAKGKHQPEDLLCQKLFASPGRFKLLFANGGYGVFEVEEGFVGDRSTSDLRPAQIADALADRETWSAYVDACATRQGGACGARLAEFASLWLHGLGKPQVAATLRSLAMQRFPEDPVFRYYVGRYLDFDAKRPMESGEHYEVAIRQLPNNAVVLREYLMWLDMEAKDERRLRRLLLKGSKGGLPGPGLLEITGMGVAELCCEAAVSALQLGMADFSKKLWARAVELAPLSKCIGTNWELMGFDPKAYLESHSPRARALAFLRAGVSHEAQSHHGPAVRLAEPRKNPERAFRLGPRAGARP